MNKCDLEETKKQIEDVISAAVADEQGWCEIPSWIYRGRFYNKRYKVTVSLYKDSHWSVELRGVSVDTIWDIDRLSYLVKHIKDTETERECQHLLRALAPARPWWKFWK